MIRQFSTKKIEKAHSKYVGVIGSLEAEMMNFVDFDFSINYQDSDGFCLLNTDNGNIAPLDFCIKAIKETGFLTAEQHTKQ